MSAVHPQVQALVDAWASDGEPPDLAAQRAGYLKTAMELGGAREPVERTEDVVIPRPDGGRLVARAYWPQVAAEPPGALVWFHGGGWCVGDLEGYDHVARALANAAGHVVVSVDYRLAPEHPFPAAADDAEAASRWARSGGAVQLGIDPARVLVGGDSAGGNLASLAALRARDDDLPPLRAQLLVYPALVPEMDTDAYREFADGATGLSAEAMERCWTGWLDGADGADATPLGRPLEGVAPAAIAVAGNDPLRDDGLRYAAALRAAGVSAEDALFDDMVHGFIRYGGVVDRTRELLDWLGRRARDALA